MKKLKISFFFLLLAVLISACSGDSVRKQVVLTNVCDSLSYYSAMHISRGVRDMAYYDMGIDSTTLDEFVAGLRASFPVNITPESRAYAYGMSLGASAMDMLEKTRAEFKAQGVDYIDSHFFLEGLVAAVCAETTSQDFTFATEYYNSKKYRDESDAFMKRNARRKDVLALPEGVQYKIEKEGNGAVATLGDTVACIYKGSFLDGKVFDTSAGEVVKFSVSELLPGIALAVTRFPAGTACTLYIPWQLGFGAKGIDGVPPYKTLVFELEIVDVIKKNRL